MELIFKEILIVRIVIELPFQKLLNNQFQYKWMELLVKKYYLWNYSTESSIVTVTALMLCIVIVFTKNMNHKNSEQLSL